VGIVGKASSLLVFSNSTKYRLRKNQNQQAEELAEKVPTFFVIPSEARNLSFFSWAWIEERFLASLGMTK
jgi:hypothetical protein